MGEHARETAAEFANFVDCSCPLNQPVRFHRLTERSPKMLATRLALLTAARRVSPRLASARCAHGHGPSQHEIEKIPPHFRNITYDDIPFPKGSWQARYDELNKKYNMLLAAAVAFSAF